MPAEPCPCPQVGLSEFSGKECRGVALGLGQVLLLNRMIYGSLLHGLAMTSFLCRVGNLPPPESSPLSHLCDRQPSLAHYESWLDERLDGMVEDRAS